MTYSEASAIQESVMLSAPGEAVTVFEQITQEFVFGQIWSRPGLSIRDRRLVTLACVCAADTLGPIEAHLDAAMRSGDLSMVELNEFTLHFAVYCGWPKASHVDTTLRQLWQRWHEERGEATPPWPTLSNDDLAPHDPEQRLSEGEKHFADINLVPAPTRDSAYYQAGILNFVFGHMWVRPGLSVRDRRLITLPCVGLSDAAGPIWAHIRSALRSGDVSYDEMQEVILQFAAYYGFAKAEVMHEVASREWAEIAATEADS